MTDREIKLMENPSRVHNETITDGMVIWEDMLQTHREDHNDEKPVTKLWNKVGTSQMRYWAAELIEPLNIAWKLLEEKGFDVDMIFDWEFTPKFLDSVDWSGGAPVADPERFVAKLLLDQALGHE